MILCKKNSKMFIFTILCSVIYTVSENRNMGSVGGGESFGKPAPGLYRSLTVQNMKLCFFPFQIKNLQNLNPIQILQVLDSVQSYSDIWGASYNICRHIYSDDFWELPRDCDQPDSEDYTMPTIMWGCW